MPIPLLPISNLLYDAAKDCPPYSSAYPPFFSRHDDLKDYPPPSRSVHSSIRLFARYSFVSHSSTLQALCPRMPLPKHQSLVRPCRAKPSFLLVKPLQRSLLRTATSYHRSHRRTISIAPPILGHCLSSSPWQRKAFARLQPKPTHPSHPQECGRWVERARLADRRRHATIDKA